MWFYNSICFFSILFHKDIHFNLTSAWLEKGIRNNALKLFHLPLCSPTPLTGRRLALAFSQDSLLDPLLHEFSPANHAFLVIFNLHLFPLAYVLSSLGAQDSALFWHNFGECCFTRGPW